MFDGSSQCTIVLPEEGLGYGLVVPFPAYGFALWFRIMKQSKQPAAWEGKIDGKATLGPRGSPATHGRERDGPATRPRRSRRMRDGCATRMRDGCAAPTHDTLRLTTEVSGREEADSVTLLEGRNGTLSQMQTCSGSRMAHAT